MYKAAGYGIQVETVDPTYSSQVCSKCGHMSRTKRNSDTVWFKGNKNGYKVGGDCVAAISIGLRLMALPSAESPDELGNSHLALKSVSLNEGNTSKLY